MTVIALDAMGGDFAPRVPVEAAVQACRDPGTEVILVGNRRLLEQELRKYPAAPGLHIHHATQNIEMHESPSAVLREKADASMRVAFELHHRGEAEAVVSAGHSGAVMVAGKHVLKTLEGIDRPAIAAPLPLKRGAAVLLDAGANVDCKPHYLLQFAQMGDVYARTVLGLAEPRVALLSNGSEPGKGNELVREAYRLLQTAPLRVVGNIEGRDLFRGKADVIVCDGFVGNLVLKSAEAANDQVRLLLKEGLGYSPMARLGRFLMRDVFRRLDRRTGYREIGASLLLGLEGVAMVCHGGSNTKTLRNAIGSARECVERDLVDRVRQEFHRRTETREAMA